MAMPAALESWLLVTRCRNQTVAKGRLDRIRGAQVDPVLSGEVVNVSSTSR